MDQGEAYNPPNKSTIIPTFAAAVSDIQKYSKKRDEPESLVKENQLAATNWNQLEWETPILKQYQIDSSSGTSSSTMLQPTEGAADQRVQKQQNNLVFWYQW